MNKYIDVDQDAIARKDPTPINIRHAGQVIRAGTVVVDGFVRITHSYDNPQPCGSRVWLETAGAVLYKDMHGEWQKIE